MTERNQTREQLMCELNRLRRKIARLEANEKKHWMGTAPEKFYNDSFLDSVERCRMLYEAAPVMLHSIDSKGRIIHVSNHWLKTLGYEAAEVLGRKSTDFLTEASRRYAEEVILPEFFEKGFCRDVEYEYVKKNKEILKVLLSAIAEKDETGKVVRSMAVLTDITARKRAEEEIIRQNKFLNNILEALTCPFYVLDANDYTIKMANSAAVHGPIPPAMTCYALTHRRSAPCDGSEHRCPLETVKVTKRPVTVEHLHYDRHGNLRNVEVHAYPIFDEKGEVFQIIEYSLDITERERMGQALRENAEKIKRFAYSISHDIKSPAIGINGLTRLLYKKYANILNETGRKYCEQILKASEQVVALVEEINVFIRTKETPLSFERIQPMEVIEMVRDEFCALLGVRQIQWVHQEGIPPIKADRLSLLRVFRNLVDNALKYGGPAMSEIRIGYRDDGEFHVFSVSDDGVGIKKEECEGIFELFRRNETSRGVEGTGLGLAIVKEVVEKHRGRVWVDTEIGRGATFYFSISKEL